MSTGAIITEGATGSKSKEGVIQWVIPYYVPSIDQVLTVGKVLYEGCEEVSRTWSCNNDGTNPSYIVTVVYEGGNAESDKNTYGDEDSTVWSLDYEMSEEPLVSHPNWDRIREVYAARNMAGDQMYDEEWSFPVELPANSSASSGLGGKTKSGGVRNPMYGSKTYIVMNALVSVSYTKKTLPPKVIKTVGKIFPDIPDAPPQFNSLDKGKRNWMKLPPQISMRGNVWQITESWRLSEHYAWPKEVYADQNATDWD